MLAFAVMMGWLDKRNKQPKILLSAAFIWGAVVAAGGAFLINSLLGTSIYTATGSPDASRLATGSVIAPVVEESLKGLGILMIYLLFHEKIETLTDGIIYAGITALGFAATENFFYIYTYGYREEGMLGIVYLFLIRVVLVGWQHPFFTLFTGIGLVASRVSRGLLLRIAAPFLGWSSAVLFHSIHNSLSDILSGRDVFLISATLDWSGWFLLAVLIAWMIYYQEGWTRRHLAELYRIIVR